MTTAEELREILTWIGVVLIATAAGLCRVLRNGQWPGRYHAIGIVGCGTFGSFFVVTFLHAISTFVANNTPLTLSLGGACGLLGKEFYEGFIRFAVGRIAGAAAIGAKSDGDTNESFPLDDLDNRGDIHRD